jgi:hypothetical protein
MASPGYGSNGSVIGPENLPTISAASGVWSLGELAEAERDSIWPAPFEGWFASWNPGIYTDSGDASSSAQIALDSSDNIYISCSTRDSSASMYTGAIAKVQSNGNGLVNNNRFDIESGGTQESIRLMGLEAAGTNLYISGDQMDGTGYAWRAKLNSSYAVQWFGDSGGDEQYVQSSQNTYANTDMKLYVSPDEAAGVHVYYGYYTSYSSYNVIMQPIDPSTGYKWYPDSYGSNAYPVMIYSNPTNVGGYVNGAAINQGRFFYMSRAYSTSYGGYNVQFGTADDMIWSGWSGMQSARMTPTGSGGSFAGVYANSPKIGTYNATGTPGEYYANCLLDIVGGTYNGNLYISKWDPYTGGYSGWSLGYRYAINAADSPATPTSFNCDSAPINDSTDTHAYFISRDNGSTPTQNYLFKHDIANQANIWQRKILIYKTADGSSGTNNAYFRKIAIDSSDEFIYGIAAINTNGTDQQECIVFKLPTDGTGSATYTVGDYTVVYGASTATGTSGDILTLGTGADGNSYTSFSNSGTLTQTVTQPTATWTKS